MGTKQPKTAFDAAYTDSIPTTPVRFAIHMALKGKVLGFFAILMVTLAEISGVVLPYILKNIVDLVTVGNTTGATDFDALFGWIVAFPIAVFLMYTFWRLSGFIGMIWLTKAEIDAFKTLFSYLTHHSHTYFSNRFAGALNNKISHASEGTFRLLDETLWGHYPAVISILVAGALIFNANLWVGIIYVILIVFLIPLNAVLSKYRRPHVVAYAKRKTKFKGGMVDVITNVSAMRQFARRPFESKMLHAEADQLRLADVKQWRMSEWILVINNAIITIAVGAMMVLMFYLWRAGSVTAGDFVLVSALVMNLQHVLTFIGNSINQFIKIYGEVEEGLDEILHTHEIVDREGATPLKATAGEVVWSDVTFKYGENTVFDTFNLTIPAGQRVGLVGSSGAGKTTFVSLLLRQHELDSGAIQIDGQDIALVTQDSLRSAISVVPQEPLLFHRSIKENIAYGNLKATKKEIEAVAKKAEAHDFVKDLPDGYDTLVGERGVKLSGGQKQRVAIARAMLKDVPVLVLDEATSALDSESEVAIQGALHTLMAGKTVIAIAHRLSTLREMDRIIVLDKGKIVEDGSHDELVKQKGIYASLWEHQAGGFIEG